MAPETNRSERGAYNVANNDGHRTGGGLSTAGRHCIADLNMDGVIGLIDRLLMGSAMVEFVPVTGVR